MLGIGLLTLFGLFTLVVYHLLRRTPNAASHLGPYDRSSRCVTMPVGAFAFQVYPEVAAGVLLTSAVLYLLSTRRTAWTALRAARRRVPSVATRSIQRSRRWCSWMEPVPVAAAQPCDGPPSGGRGAGLRAFCLYVYHVTGSLLRAGCTTRAALI